MLPLEVLEASAKALVDFQGKGLASPRSVIAARNSMACWMRALALVKKFAVGPRHARHLVSAGWGDAALRHHPMNFLNGPADYVVGGEWSKKAVDMAKPIAGDKLRVIATSEATSFDRPPTGWTADPAAAYLHVCSNETVHGHRLPSGRSMRT